MTNKLAKAVVPALTRIVGPVAVCQRGIVDVPLVWREGRQDATQAHLEEPHHCSAQMLQTLEGAGSAVPMPAPEQILILVT